MHSTHRLPHTAACATHAHRLTPVLSQASAEMPPGGGHIAGTSATEVWLVVLTQAQEVSDLKSVPLGGQTREQQAQHVEDGQSQQPRLGPVCLLEDTAPDPSPRRPQLKTGPASRLLGQAGQRPLCRSRPHRPRANRSWGVRGDHAATSAGAWTGKHHRPRRHLPPEAPGFPCL